MIKKGKGKIIMDLTNEERMLVNSEIQRRGKSTLVAYLLLIFLGTLGIHRFYLGRTGTAVTQLVLTIIGWLTAIILIGFALLAVVWVWVIVDLFLVPGIIEAENDKLEKDVISTLKK